MKSLSKKPVLKTRTTTPLPPPPLPFAPSCPPPYPDSLKQRNLQRNTAEKKKPTAQGDHRKESGALSLQDCKQKETSESRSARPQVRCEERDRTQDVQPHEGTKQKRKRASEARKAA